MKSFFEWLLAGLGMVFLAFHNAGIYAGSRDRPSRKRRKHAAEVIQLADRHR